MELVVFIILVIALVVHIVTIIMGNIVIKHLENDVDELTKKNAELEKELLTVDPDADKKLIEKEEKLTETRKKLANLQIRYDELYDSYDRECIDNVKFRRFLKNEFRQIGNHSKHIEAVRSEVNKFEEE